MPLQIYNSLSKKTDNFTPVHPPRVGLYTCGATVYDYAHIGHGRKYVGDDIIRRTLVWLGYNVTHVQNVTDVGHLVSDNDEGEDKMEKGAAKTGKTVWDVAKFFMNDFYASMDLLNIMRPHIICRATEHIPDQIALIETLVAKGYGYETPEAVYFDVSKFSKYGSLTGQTLDQKRTAAREEVETGVHKKNPADFVLWFKCVGKYQNHVMRWNSQWGEGFPGWHIECSAMSMKYLGETIDIHTGGIDHLSVHHPNEIAQSEAATGKQFVRYWIHHEFLTVDGQKMSKSIGNTYRMHDITERGFDPLALRYFFLTAHYRSPQNFTWEALQNAQNSLNELRGKIMFWKTKKTEPLDETKIKQAETRFQEIICNDINIPRALAFAWEIVKDKEFSEKEKEYLITDSFDKIFGLKLKETNENAAIATANLPENIKELVIRRESARTNKDFESSDKLRKELETLGYSVTDSPDGQRVRQF
ncbi:MAG: Cysteine-tRNA ligase [Parcubacteria group bacterium GW2011_GWB1_46_8]|nr:MAG: Cysteine-tRNA ligase [Parcubacteria group bacterium GW2011_GWF1_45_5]KKU10656.1 MAG: Cysteine-tRNA ligase [Parcubacteria group bacterium GW2011_GWA1_45_7]KKU45938.1 MAG: Cysteine-tRNA ligase [Parcubacteria group bacterium GW2011_GWB1_46_8]